MLNTILNKLVDPVLKTALTIQAMEQKSSEVVSGELINEKGGRYKIENGIPRFVICEEANQKQTEKSFGFKWSQRDTYESEQMKRAAREWIVPRYGFNSGKEMQNYFLNKKNILDAGCGGGFTTSLWMNDDWEKGGANWFGVDISDAIDVAKSRLGNGQNRHYFQADLMRLPFPRESFEIIFSEGVLHHTPSTEGALESLVSLLKRGGEMMFYVYRKKGPIREFADDFIRDFLAPKSPPEAWELLKPLTKLGEELTKLHATVNVPEDIPYLNIKAGKHDVQRLIYWHFLKLYWNEKCTLDENNHVNFDWYHPRYAHRQTEEEVKSWCEKLALEIKHFKAEESGITVRAIKQ